jgi:hypothetical protein
VSDVLELGQCPSLRKPAQVNVWGFLFLSQVSLIATILCCDAKDRRVPAILDSLKRPKVMGTEAAIQGSEVTRTKLLLAQIE